MRHIGVRHEALYVYWACALLKTSNAPFFILPIYSMQILWVTLILQYNKFIASKSIFWFLKNLRSSFLSKTLLRIQPYFLNSQTFDWFSCTE